LTAEDSLVEYYVRRAGEYEEVYGWRDPDRYREQEMLAIAIRDSLRERDVLEVWLAAPDGGLGSCRNPRGV